jgi:hypothetical protein
LGQLYKANRQQEAHCRTVKTRTIISNMSGSDGLLSKIVNGDQVAGVQRIDSGKSKDKSKKKPKFWPFKAKKEGPKDIGTPFEVKQIGHVGFDKASGQFVGLPQEWKVQLAQSGITSSDIQDNPDAVLKALEFQDRFMKNNELGGTPSVPNALRRLNVGGGAVPAPSPPPIGRFHSSY